MDRYLSISYSTTKHLSIPLNTARIFSVCLTIGHICDSALVARDNRDSLKNGDSKKRRDDMESAAKDVVEQVWTRAHATLGRLDSAWPLNEAFVLIVFWSP